VHAAAAITSVIGALSALTPSASVAISVTVELPDAVGVPLICPLEVSIDNPLGRPVALHFSGGLPPVAVAVAE
jgi:hypothetical protein